MEVKLSGKLMGELYAERKNEQIKRYSAAITKFIAGYKREEFMIISVPGRTEIAGNHTDHQRGKVIASGVSLDAVAVFSHRPDSMFNLISEGYKKLTVDISDLIMHENEKNTSSSLIRGVAAAYKKRGFNIGGADVYLTSDVPVGSGLSSSAQFCVAVANIFNHMYNSGEIDAVTNAIVARSAENDFFGKPCGLMDQLACSVGGIIAIDFADEAEPKISKIQFDMKKHGYALCVIDTGGSHADLTEEYASIPSEMGRVASYFGKDVLSEVDENDFYAQAGFIRADCGERALIRAHHYFSENARVEKIIEALADDDIDAFLKLENEGGRSSYMYLQNAYPSNDITQRGLCVAMAFSEKLLNGTGACRIHGGGMAGTIQVFVPQEELKSFKKAIERIFGEDSCRVLALRNSGAIRVM